MTDITPSPSTTLVDASLIAQAQTREIERLWHSSRPKPRPKAMGFLPDESHHHRRRRELHDMLAADQNLRNKLYQIQ